MGYIKNVAKSFKYAAPAVVKQLVPHVASNYSQNKDLFTQTGRMLVDHKKLVDRGMKFWDKTGGELGRNVASDLKTGNLYNKERQDKVLDKMLGLDGDDDMDFGDMDAMFSDMDDGDADFGEGDDHSESSSDSGNVEVTNNKKYVADNRRVVNKVANVSNVRVQQGGNEGIEIKKLGGLNIMLNDRLIGGMETMSGQMAQMSEFTMSATNDFYKKSMEYYTTSTGLLGEISSNIESVGSHLEKHVEFFGMNKSKSSKKESDFERVITPEGAVDIGEYLKTIKKNMNGDGTGETVKQMFQAYVANPIGEILTDVISTRLPDAFKKAATQFNEVVAGIPAAFVLKMSTWANDDASNPIKKIIGKVFGMGTKWKTNSKLGDYEKGSIAFDGVTKKAITQVIPNLLSKILSAISGKGEMVFDYESGKFKDKKETLARRDKSIENMYSINSEGQEKVLKGIMKKEGWDAEKNVDEITQATKELDILFKTYAKRGQDIKKDLTQYDVGTNGFGSVSDMVLNRTNQHLQDSIGTDSAYGFNLSRDIADAKSSATRFFNNEMKGVENGSAQARLDGDLDKSSASSSAMFSNKNSSSIPEYLLETISLQEKMVGLLSLLVDCCPGGDGGGSAKAQAIVAGKADYKSIVGKINTNRKSLESGRAEAIQQQIFLEEQQKDEEEKKNQSDRDKAAGTVKDRVKGWKDAILNPISDIFEGDGSIKNKLGKIFSLPFTYLEKGLKSASKTMAQLFFGKDTKSKLGLFLKGLKDSITNPFKNFFFGKRNKDGVLEDGKEGFINKAVHWFDKDVKQPISNFLFGKSSKDKNGNLIKEGGLFNKIKTKFDDKILNPAKAFLFGSTKIDENGKKIKDIGLVNKMKVKLNQATFHFKKMLIGKDADGNDAARKDIHETSVLDSLKMRLQKTTDKLDTWLFGEKDKDGNRIAEGLINEDFKKKMMGAGIGSKLGELIMPGYGKYLGAVLGVVHQTEVVQDFLYNKENGVVIKAGRNIQKFAKDTAIKADKYFFGEKSEDENGKVVREGGVFKGVRNFFNDEILMPTKTYLFGHYRDIAGETFRTGGMFDVIKGKFEGLYNKSKDFLFGNSKKDGEDGWFNKGFKYTKEHILDPIGRKLKETFNDLTSFFKEEIFKPMKTVFRPFWEEFKHQFTNMRKWGEKVIKSMADSLNDRFAGFYGKSFGEMFKEKIIDPMSSALEGIRKSLLSIFKTVFKTPVNILTDAAGKLRERHAGLGIEYGKKVSGEHLADSAFGIKVKNKKEKISIKDRMKTAKENRKKEKIDLKNETIAAKKQATNTANISTHATKQTSLLERILSSISRAFDPKAKSPKSAKSIRKDKQNTYETLWGENSDAFKAEGLDSSNGSKFGGDGNKVPKSNLKSKSSVSSTGLSKAGNVAEIANTMDNVADNAHDAAMLAATSKMALDAKQSRGYLGFIRRYLPAKWGKISFKKLLGGGKGLGGADELEEMAKSKGLGGIFRAVSAPFRIVGKALGDVAKGLGGVLKNILKIPTALLNGIGEVISGIGPALINGIGHVVEGLGSVVKNILTGASSLLESIASSLKGVAEGLGKAVGSLIEGFGSLVSSIGRAVGSLIEMAVNAIPSVISGLAQLGGGLLNGAGKAGSKITSKKDSKDKVGMGLFGKNKVMNVRIVDVETQPPTKALAVYIVPPPHKLPEATIKALGDTAAKVDKAKKKFEKTKVGSKLKNATDKLKDKLAKKDKEGNIVKRRFNIFKKKSESQLRNDKQKMYEKMMKKSDRKAGIDKLAKQKATEARRWEKKDKKEKSALEKKGIKDAFKKEKEEKKKRSKQEKMYTKLMKKSDVLAEKERVSKLTKSERKGEKKANRLQEKKQKNYNKLVRKADMKAGRSNDRNTSATKIENAKNKLANSGGVQAVKAKIQAKKDKKAAKKLNKKKLTFAERTARNTGAINKGFKKLGGFLKFLFPVVAGILKWFKSTKLGAIVARGVSSLGGLISKAVGTLINGIGTVIGGLFKAAKWIGGGVVKAGKWVGGKALTAVKSGLTTVGGGSAATGAAGLGLIAAGGAVAAHDYAKAKERGEEGLKLAGSTLIGNAGDTTKSMLLNGAKQAAKWGLVGAGIGTLIPIPGVGTLLGGGIGALAGFVAGMFGSDPGPTIEKIKGAFSGIGDMFKSLWSNFDGVMDKIGPNLKAIFAMIVNPIGTLFGSFFGNYEDKSFIQKIIYDGFIKVKAGLFDIIDKLTGGFATKLTESKPYRVIMGSIQLIGTVVKKTMDFLVGVLWKGFKWGISTIIKVLKTTFKVIGKVAKTLWKVAKFIFGIPKFVRSTIKKYLLKPLVNFWKDKIAPAFEKVKDYFGEIINRYFGPETIIGKGIAVMSNVIKGIVDVIVKVANAIIKAINKIPGVKDMAKIVVDKAEDAYDQEAAQQQARLDAMNAEDKAKEASAAAEAGVSNVDNSVTNTVNNNSEFGEYGANATEEYGINTSGESMSSAGFSATDYFGQQPGFRGVSSPYGMRIHPIEKVEKMHNGIDFAANTGTPIAAPMGGRVFDAKYKSTGFGRRVALVDDNGNTHIFAHLHKNFVNAGDIVKPGQIIGEVGSTGGSTGPHLHYEVRKGEGYSKGSSINPNNYLSGGNMGAMAGAMESFSTGGTASTTKKYLDTDSVMANVFGYKQGIDDIMNGGKDTTSGIDYFSKSTDTYVNGDTTATTNLNATASVEYSPSTATLKTQDNMTQTVSELATATAVSNELNAKQDSSSSFASMIALLQEINQSNREIADKDVVVNVEVPQHRVSNNNATETNLTSNNDGNNDNNGNDVKVTSQNIFTPVQNEINSYNEGTSKSAYGLNGKTKVIAMGV